MTPNSTSVERSRTHRAGSGRNTCHTASATVTTARPSVRVIAGQGQVNEPVACRSLSAAIICP